MRIYIFVLLAFLLVGCNEGSSPVTFNPNIEEADLLIENNQDVRRAVRKKCRTVDCVKSSSAKKSSLPSAPEKITLSYVASGQGDRGRKKNGRWCVIRSVPGLKRDAEVCTYRIWYKGQSEVDLVLVEGTANMQVPRYIGLPPRYIRADTPTNNQAPVTTVAFFHDVLNAMLADMKWDVVTIEDTREVAKAVLKRLEAREGAQVLALSGDLGSGKTTFTQQLADLLGVTDTVTSPTFVIMKGYETTDATWQQLIHMDAYRIEELDELRPLGFDQLVQTPNTLFVIEWAERIADALPNSTIHLTFTHTPQHRTIECNDR